MDNPQDFSLKDISLLPIKRDLVWHNSHKMISIALKYGYKVHIIKTKQVNPFDLLKSTKMNMKFMDSLCQKVNAIFSENAPCFFKKIQSGDSATYAFDFREFVDKTENNGEESAIPDFIKEKAFGIFWIQESIHGFVFNKETKPHFTNKYVGSMKKEIGNFYKKNKVAEKVKMGSFYMLAKSGNSFYLTDMGTVKTKLIKTNYNQDVVASHLEVVEEFKKPVPFGRLAVYDGPPGTGKTHLIENLIASFPSDKFTVLIIPNELIPEISKPDILPTLIRHSTNPYIFILEDADDALVERSDSAKTTQLSALLNLCDGTLGKKLNVRVIATTNLSFETKEGNKFTHKIDPAANRPGRMFKRIHVSSLSPEEASIAVSRIAEKEFIAHNRMTLAECYEKGYQMLKAKEKKSK